MKILTIGTGPSTQDFIAKNKKIKDDIKTFGLHRSFPYIYDNSDIKMDYWSWADPDAAIQGLKIYEKTDIDDLPTIVMPRWLSKIHTTKMNMGGSAIYRNKKHIDFYESILIELEKSNKIIYIENSTSTKNIQSNHKIFKNVEHRFNNSVVYIGSTSCNGGSWGAENKFSFLILPICHYLGAVEVYCLGFDNHGIGINNSRVTSSKRVQQHLNKLKLWVEWESYHQMKIYSVVEDKFTPNNTILEYKPIEEICKK